MAKGFGPDSDTKRADIGFNLGVRRIFILPTRGGLAYALIMCAMLAASMNYENSLGYLLTFLLGAIGLLSLLLSMRDLYRLDVRTQDAAAVFAGDRASFGISLQETAGRRRFGAMLRWDEPSGTRIQRVRITPGEQRLLSIDVQTAERGVVEIAPFALVSRYPFGLFRAWAPVQPQNVAQVRAVGLVYPSPSGLLPLPASDGEKARAERASNVAGHDDFAGFKSYQLGDSLKHVHWKRATTSDALVVKTFSGDASDEISLDFEEVRAAVPSADTEACLSQLCRWVLQADQLGLSYRLVLPGETIGPGTGPAMREQALRGLALYQNGDR